MVYFHGLLGFWARRSGFVSLGMMLFLVGPSWCLKNVHVGEEGYWGFGGTLVTDRTQPEAKKLNR